MENLTKPENERKPAPVFAPWSFFDSRSVETGVIIVVGENKAIKVQLIGRKLVFEAKSAGSP